VIYEKEQEEEREMIKLPQFLKEVDAVSSKLSHEELEKILHEIARTWSENHRESFLQLLKSYESGMGEVKEDSGSSDVISDIKEIMECLVEINDEERHLNSEYNEEWDDWYNSDADEILFTDPDGILKDIGRAMELIHSCVDMEIYKEGCELAETLAVLEVWAEGDYEDYDGSTLYLYDLERYHLLMYDYEEFVKECLYLIYMGNELENRAEELFCMIGSFGKNNIRLEDIMQKGNDELSEFDEFLIKWINYLGQQKGKQAETLLKEAQSFIQDDALLLENARKYVKEHPVLYKQLLELNLESDKNEEMYQIGMEALNKIPVSYIVRSDIALLTAVFAQKMNEIEKAEQCRIEAFRSNSSVINYLRIRFMSHDWNIYRGEINSIFERVFRESGKRDTGYSYYREHMERENSLYKNAYCTLLFFEGQLENMYTVGMNIKEGLGWSATFMKQGLSLMMLLLFSGEELPIGLRAMRSRVYSECEFSAEEYYRGTTEVSKESGEELFTRIYLCWKKEVSLSEDERNLWIDRIDKWLTLRVSEIMKNNRRGYYEECAAFIAAFGEVQESLGNPNAKARIMEQYRKEYFRRTAFHRELRAYGMKK